MKNHSKEDGFTVIEIVVFFVILAVLAIFFVMQKIDLETSFSDQERKTAINALYFNLTEIYYTENGYYPGTIESDTLSGIDPDLLYDPWGYMINGAESDYNYEGLDCDGNNHCKAFRLTAELEKEDNYIIESEN